MKHNLIKNTLLRGVLCLLLCVVGLASAWGEEVKFKLHTGDVTDGYYIIVSNGVAMNNQTSSNRLQYDNITISNNIIQAEGNAKYVWYITSEENGTYTIKNASNNYYAGSTGNQNQATTKNASIDNKSKWYITNNETTCSIENVYNKNKKINYTIRRNSTYGFACYASSTGTAPILYKKIEEPEQIKTVTKLSITDLYSETKREYYIGETPSTEGLAVTATYEDNSTGDITPLVSWSFEPATILSNTTSVTATASYEDKSAQYTYNIINKGEKTFHDYTLDLSTNSYSSASTDTVKWDAVVASMTLSKGEGTNNANHHLGGSENIETSFYTGHNITIIPKAQIYQIVFTTATSKNYTYAKTLNSSTYTNATSSQNDNTVTITPIDGNKDISLTLNGTCGCTAMTIYYLPIVSTLTDAGYSTLCLPYNATVPIGLTAYTATDNGEFVKLTAKEDGKIAAGEGVVLKGNVGTYTFVAAEGSVSATEGNLMVGVTEETQLTEADNAYMLTRKKDDGSIAFRLLKTDYTLGANKAYLKVDGSANTRELIPAIWDDNATGIENTAGSNITNIIYNLAGQKLTRAQKGVNIINGKLIVK